MMKRTTVALGLASAMMLLSSPLGAQDKPEELATRRAEAWLALVDQGKYEESWSEASRLFKDAVTKEKWKEALSAVRPPLGKLLSRKLKSRQQTRTLPGAPDGSYVVIQYDSSFESKKQATETITPMLDPDGTWRVSGYFIK
ncbi:MAG: DUF4019 domain-containing protein [Solirubrobacterales bacterium]